MLAVCCEAGVVQDLRDLQHDLAELVHGDDDHALVGGLDAMLLQVLIEGVETAADEEVPPLQGHGPVAAGEKQAGFHLGCGDDVPLAGAQEEGVFTQTCGVGKVIRRQLFVDLPFRGRGEEHRHPPPLF